MSTPATQRPLSTERNQRDAMYHQFTDSARSTMLAANRQAERYGHSYIGNLHILLGAIEVAPEVFESASLDVVTIRDAAARLLKQTGSTGAKATLVSALEQAKAYGDGTAGVLHVLLGMLIVPDTSVVALFREVDERIDDVRQRLLASLDTD